jgi:hypothetical protein
MFEGLQVPGKRRCLHASCFKCPEIGIVSVKALATRDQLQPTKEQAEPVGVLRVCLVWVGVERSLGYRIANDEEEV